MAYTSNQNPIFPDTSGLYIADPEPKVFSDRVYVYGSLDVEGGELPSGINWCSDRYHVIYSDDLNHWHDAGVSFHLDSIPEEFRNSSQTRLWAPDVLQNPNDGKYYLFLCTNGKSETKIFVAVSDMPQGPFGKAVPLLIDGKTPIGEIDPGVLVDDDGKAYITWPFKIAQLDPDDYSRVLGNTIVDVRQWMPEENPPFEGPSLRKRGEIYYYIYIQNDGPREFQSPEGKASPTRMAYMTSKYPLGPYEYQGLIMETSGYPAVINVHGSFVEFKDQWYQFYHLPVIDKFLTRKMCADKLFFHHDGTIEQVTITSSGISGPFRAGDTILAGSAVIWPEESLSPKYLSRKTDHPVLIFKNEGSYVGYRYVSLEGNQEFAFEVSLKSVGGDGILELRFDKPDGPLASSLKVPDTNGEWIILKSEILGDLGRARSFFVILKNATAGSEVIIEWLRFSE